MMIQAGSNPTIDIQIVDDTGLAVTGLVAATFPTLTYSLAGANATVAFPSLSDLAALTTAYFAGGVKERTGGFYRVDCPTGLAATAGAVARIEGEATGKHVLCPAIDVGPVGGFTSQIIPNGTGTIQSTGSANAATNSIVLQTALGNDNLGLFNTCVLTNAAKTKQYTGLVVGYVNSTLTLSFDPLVPFPVVIDNTWTYEIRNATGLTRGAADYTGGEVVVETNQDHTLVRSTPIIDGVPWNPTNIPQHTVNLLNATGLKRVRMTPDSGFNLVEDWPYHVVGYSGSIFFNGFDITKSIIENTTISGVTIARGVQAVAFTGTGLNDATSGGVYIAGQHTYTVIIDHAGTPDTFKWSKDFALFTTGVAITGAAQTLTDGVTITFAATTGHTLGDQSVIVTNDGCAKRINDCTIGVTTMFAPQKGFIRPIFLGTTFTAPNSALPQNYLFVDGVNMDSVAAVFNFGAVTQTTVLDLGIVGSATLTLNTHCACVVRAPFSGTITATTGGGTASLSLYGDIRSTNIVISGSETINQNGINGTTVITGTTSGTVTVNWSGIGQVPNTSGVVLTGAGAINVHTNLPSMDALTTQGKTLAFYGSAPNVNVNTIGESPVHTDDFSPVYFPTTTIGRLASQADIVDTSGVTTLLARLTSARSGYLDNLNVGGPVASHADFVAMNVSVSKHMTLQASQQMEPGETFEILMYTFSPIDGSAINADTTPTLTATGRVSGSLSSNLAAATNPATGKYSWIYTPGATPTLEQIRFDGSATISSSTFNLSALSQTVDEATVLWTATDQTHLTAVYNKLPAGSIADESLVIAAIPTAVQNRQEMDANSTKLANLDTTVSSRLALSSYASPPTPSQNAAGVWAYILTGSTSAGTMLQAIWNWISGGDLTSTMKASVTAAVPAAPTIAAAVRDVNNLAPAANSLGAAVNDAIGGEIIVHNSVVVPAAVAIASQKPNFITVIVGDTLSIELPLLGTITGWTQVLFFAKSNGTDPDDKSIIGVVVNAVGGGGGLTILNGAAAPDSTQGSLTVNDVTTGDVTLVLSSIATDALEIQKLYWGCKFLSASRDKTPVTNGVMNVVLGIIHQTT